MLTGKNESESWVSGFSVSCWAVPDQFVGACSCLKAMAGHAGRIWCGTSLCMIRLVVTSHHLSGCVGVLHVDLFAHVRSCSLTTCVCIYLEVSRGRCLHLGIMPCYLVWRVPFSGESIHFLTQTPQ
jgi:hypothetical protein